jgi:transposase
MSIDWLDDGRKIPDDVMDYLRIMAVNAVRVLGFSPEKVAESYNFDRSCLYRWLKQYDKGGFEALETKKPPGAERLITSEADEWLKKTILTCTPVEFGYDTNLWTCTILAKLLKEKFGVTVSDTAVRFHLKAMGLTCQKP